MVGSVPEPEWDEEQRALMRGLHDYERSLNALGFLVDEATTKNADKNNRDATHSFVAEGVIDHSLLAESDYRKSLSQDDPYRDARVVRVRRVER